jgi:hypothetical protein
MKSGVLGVLCRSNQCQECFAIALLEGSASPLIVDELDGGSSGSG